MRDHRKLKAFAMCDRFVLQVYQATNDFPSDERFGLRAQIRRAAVSVPSNIVEGCARSSELEYLRFLDIALGSLREALYQIDLAHRLQFIETQLAKALEQDGNEAARTLGALINSLAPADPRRAERQPAASPQDPGPKTQDGRP